MDNTKKEKEISLELSREVLRGKYSNLAIISHSPSEFVLDFASVLPGIPKAEVGSRIIMTPEHAKRLLNALMDNINNYENQFGEINLNKVKQGIPYSFGPNSAEA